LVGIIKPKTSQDDDVDMGQNVPLNGTKCHIHKKTMGQNVALNGTKCHTEWDKMSHPIKNKEENKEKNKAMPENSDTTQTTQPVKTTATATKLSALIERSHLGSVATGNYDSTFKGYSDSCHASANMGGASHA
jgi:hypothetical protein